MLKKFKVKNFKNFKDELYFDFADTKNYEYSLDCIKDGIVKTGLIYGINGCGKSNLAFAIFDIVSHLTDMETNTEGYINYLNASSSSSFAEFYYEFQFGNSILEYAYGKKDLQTLVFERLKINGEIIIEYDKQNANEKYFKISLAGTETLNRDLSQIRISVLKYIKTNTVLINNAINQTLFDFFNFIDGMLRFRSLEDRFYQGYEVGSVDIGKYIADNYENDFNSFLHSAGIDIKITVEKINGQPRLFMKFDKELIDFYSNASTGTKTLTLFYFWLKRMEEHKSSVVFIDEFDAFYHQELSEFIVCQLKKLDCQVLLTTHNTRLLNNEISRPDCCFILKKNNIYNLASAVNKELREAHNIEKMYRAKVFDK